MLAALYIQNGWRAYRHPEQLAEQSKAVTDRVAPLLTAVYPKAPTDARTLVKLNGAVQVVGGVLLASGQAARPGALLLAASHAPTTFAGQRFWETKDPTERAQQRTEFLRNVSMLGGLLITAMDTAGQPGIAWRTGYVARETKRSVRRAAKDTRRSVGRATSDAQHAVTQVGKDAQLSVSRVAGKATGAAGLAAGVATGAASRASTAASRAAEAASDRANRAAESVSHAAAVAKARALALTGS